MSTSYTTALVPASATASGSLARAQPVVSINPNVDPAILKRMVFVSDSALKNGTRLVAGPGAGKSRFLGKFLSWQMFVRNKPVVILDPTGGVADNLIDKMVRLPQEVRKKLWPRLFYVDAGATDFVVPTPLYYRLHDQESLFTAANRFLSVIKRQDPDLTAAPIQGWNALHECGMYAGQIAVALGRQLDFVADLARNPRSYKEELKEALAAHPELLPAVSYFRDLMDPNSHDQRARKTSSFLNKLLPFLADPPMMATFSAPTRSLDWEQMVAENMTVIIDLRHELDPDRRQFKMLWYFRELTDYIKYRGMAGRGQEIMLVIDEVTQLLGQRSGEGHSLLAEDLEELVAVLGRNMGCNVVIAHQNLSQVEERIRNVLMQMGTQIIGTISNPEDARYLAQQLVSYDPFWIKKRVPVWMADLTEFRVIDETTVEFTPEEQEILAAAQFLRGLKRFEFFVRAAAGEGNTTGTLQRISIANMDRNQYPDAQEIARVRALLRQKCGVPMQTLLKEIERRNLAAPELSQNHVQMEKISTTLKNDGQSADSVTDAVSPVPDPGANDDHFWQ